MGKYRPITTAYINNAIYDRYLNEKERFLLSGLDMSRVLAMEDRNSYKHFNNDVFYRFYDLNIKLREEIYGRYILEYSDNPEQVLQDVTTTLNDITPAAFFEDEFVFGRAHTDDLQTFCYNELTYLCNPMIRTLDRGGHKEQIDIVEKMVLKRAKECAKYAEKRFERGKK